MLERAKQKRSIVKNFIKLENFKNEKQGDSFFNQDGSSTDGGDQGEFGSEGNQFGGKRSSHGDDDFELLYGIENE